VQLFHGGAFGQPRINWDGHENLEKNHAEQAAIMDKPVAGLLKDLKARGMLEDTLVLWTTEFGRTPITQGMGEKGRDHHPHAFTIWMAGAGLKPGFGYGSSDEVGYFAAEKPVQVYDFHATVLHLLGLDHERLTFYHNGIQRRLTDVHGHVINGLLS
jgi:arylsulfatase A-like enzyme